MIEQERIFCLKTEEENGKTERFKDIKFALPYVKFNFKKEEKNGQKNT